MNHLYSLFIGASLMSGLALATAENLPKFTSNTINKLMEVKTSAQRAPSLAPQTISTFVKFSNREALDEMRELGVQVGAVGKTIATAVIPVDVIDKVAEIEGVVYIDAASTASLAMDVARGETGVEKVHNPSLAEDATFSSPYTGKGVIVGVIDGGVDFNHPAFKTDDLKEMRLKNVWLHAETSGGNPPTGFNYGVLYDTPEAISAKKTDLSYYSHGSHVMGIAAGANTSNPYHGIAYDAELAFSTFTEIDTEIGDAISWLFSLADKEEKPMVINMSLGTNMGPHDGTSPRDVLADELCGPGHILVGASGNNAMIPMHVKHTFTEDSTTVLLGMAFLEGYSGQGELQIWGEPGKELKVNVCTISKTTLEPVFKSRTFNCSKSYSGTVTLQKPYDESSGTFSIVTQTSPLNTKPMAHITLAISDYTPTKVIGIMVTGEPGATFHAWANENYCCFKQHLSNMMGGDNNYGECEIGGTGKSIITVGSYSTKTSVTKLNGDLAESGYVLNDIAPYSNLGPTADERLKPDIAAPGSLIVAPFNGNESANTERVAEYQTADGQKYYYGVYQGTSMASPHVTGTIATWLQAYPYLTPADIRTVLDNTSRTDEYTGTCPNNTWGRGKIDAYAGLKYILKSYTSGVESPTYSSTEPWAISVGDNAVKVMHAYRSSATQISLYNTAGALVRQNSCTNAQPGDELTVSLTDLSAGVYVAAIAGEGSTSTVKVLVK